MGTFRDAGWVWEGVAFDPGVEPTIYGVGEGAKYFGLDRVNFMFHRNNHVNLSKLQDVGEVVPEISKWKWVQIEPEPGEHGWGFAQHRDSDPATVREEAENVSRLSVDFPNITGALIDDTHGMFDFDSFSQDRPTEILTALHSANPDLKLWLVVYTHELELEQWRSMPVGLLPYGVQKSTVMERIGTEVRSGRIEGVSDVRDESDHEGMRLVVETSRGHDPNRVLESLLQYTQLRETFGAQMLALVPTEEGMRPEYLSLRDALVHFVQHRLTVIERRSRFEREKLKARLHIVEGLLIALAAIDEVVATIKKSKTRESARSNLQRAFKLSDEQAAAIVAMPLGNLASLEVKKLEDEQKALKKRITELTRLIDSEAARLGVVQAETTALKSRFNTPRRTLILDSEQHAGSTVTAADLTEPQIVSLYDNEVERRDCPGYADRAMLGLTGRRTPVPIGRWYAEPGERLFMVAADGDGWHAPVLQVDGNAAAGKRIVGGGIIREDSKHVVLITRLGKIKRVRIDDLPLSMGSWVRVIGLAKNDEVLAAGIDTGDEDEVMIFSQKGYAIRFKTGDVNPQQSSSAQGVAAMRVGKDDHLLSAAVFDPAVAGHVVIASEAGWIKRVPMELWPIQGRAGKGVQSLRITKASGNVAAATVVRSDDNYVDLLNADGKRLRFKYEVLPVDNRANRGAQIPAVLRKQDKKDRTKLEEIGLLQRATGLSSTYTYRGK